MPQLLHHPPDLPIAPFAQDHFNARFLGVRVVRDLLGHRQRRQRALVPLKHDAPSLQRPVHICLHGTVLHDHSVALEVTEGRVRQAVDPLVVIRQQNHARGVSI
eukprot:scaffold1466_cov249-Pinguiococcus_pyrenoidosus.AAC.3